MRVDDDLLALCNRAYDEATRRAASRVEIAHVVWCLTVAASTAHWFERAGASRAVLGDAVDRWLVQASRVSGSVAVQTSDDLKTLLARAEQIAAREQRQFAGPQDFLSALVRASSDLASASFANAEIRNQASPPTAANRTQQRPAEPEPKPRTVRHDHRPVRWVQGELPLERTVRRRDMTAPRWTDHDTHASTAASPGQSAPYVHHREPDPRQFSAGCDETGKLVLLDRLEQQEFEVAELRALVARLLERRQGGAGEAARTDHASVGSERENRGSGHLWRARLRRRASDPAEQRPPAVRLGATAGSGSSGSSGDASHGQPRRAGVEPTRPRYRVVRDTEMTEPLNAVPDNDAEDDGDVTGDRMKRFYLSPDDDIVKAPSIGPRTAARLKPAGLVLVRDLLACDPAEVAARTAIRYITADRIGDWKAQARLVCTIPWLRGTHAQLLVGAGFDTIGKLMRADASVVCAAILRFAATREGQSILRSGPPPEIDRIACWIENTALAEPARAA